MLRRSTTSLFALKRGFTTAFTLIELLVVISIIGILAGLTMPVLSRAKDKGKQAFCNNSLHQIALGFALYHADFDDMFPAPGSKKTYGPQPEDWIWWQYGRGISNSTIGRYVEKFNPKIFTCPADRDAQDLQAKGILPNDPYRYSYSLTSYDLYRGRNLGMATIITQSREVFAFRMNAIKNPSAKIMLVEEDRATIDDPRWVPEGNQPNLVTSRHNQHGNVVFADSHIATVTAKFGMNKTNSQPEL